MQILINRIVEGVRSTLGELQILDKGKVIFRCNTLELPNKHNQQNISSIPTGSYQAFKRYTRGKWVLELKEVPNRTNIQIHSANFYTQIEGCFAVGTTFADINKDGYYDVTDSVNTMDEILGLIPNDIQVIVKKKLV